MNVGDYVRTISGKIYIIIDNDNSDYIKVKNEYNGTYKIDISNTTKSSPNIIDLIEVGDYVNGTIVTKVVLDEIECKYIELDYTYNKRGIREKDIKSIVTKEQFSQMEYKVGE